ncbi:hypothetical protein BLNAU_9313 [Blattamonas nauphoetae]|uniref:Uncharacterized protein n=1 Tax=Blattamonas nauphoetae TaxID=2049346 RepID=A0ABQ9XWC2_9EUKA|nr:hypothetical protein BLNAU_9313 [Blattamonas nauphoetae]
MGTLVFRSFVHLFADENIQFVRRWIAIAPPFQGGTHVLRALLFGYNLGLPKFVISPNLMQLMEQVIMLPFWFRTLTDLPSTSELTLKSREKDDLTFNGLINQTDGTCMDCEAVDTLEEEEAMFEHIWGNTLFHSQIKGNLILSLELREKMVMNNGEGDYVSSRYTPTASERDLTNPIFPPFPTTQMMSPNHPPPQPRRSLHVFPDESRNAFDLFATQKQDPPQKGTHTHDFKRVALLPFVERKDAGESSLKSRILAGVFDVLSTTEYRLRRENDKKARDRFQESWQKALERSDELKFNQDDDEFDLMRSAEDSSGRTRQSPSARYTLIRVNCHPTNSFYETLRNESDSTEHNPLLFYHTKPELSHIHSVHSTHSRLIHSTLVETHVLPKPIPTQPFASFDRVCLSLESSHHFFPSRAEHGLQHRHPPVSRPALWCPLCPLPLPRNLRKHTWDGDRTVLTFCAVMGLPLPFVSVKKDRVEEKKKGFFEIGALPAKISTQRAPKKTLWKTKDVPFAFTQPSSGFGFPEAEQMEGEERSE